MSAKNLTNYELSRAVEDTFSLIGDQNRLNLPEEVELYRELVRRFLRSIDNERKVLERQDRIEARIRRIHTRVIEIADSLGSEFED